MRIFTHLKLVPVLCALIALMASASASASTPAPGWEIVGRTAPTNLAPGSNAILTLYVFNVGAAPGEGATLTDTLPPGVTANGGQVRSSGGFETGFECSGASVVTCPLGESPLRSEYVGTAIMPGQDVTVEIPVTVATGLSGSAVDRASVAGGGASSPAAASVPMSFSSTPASLAFAGFDAWATNTDGSADTQAGSHPFELTVAFALNTELNARGNEVPAGGEARNIDVNLPAGIVGNPRAVPQCARPAFEHESCPLSTQVGEDYTTGTQLQLQFSIYNLVPPPGIPAQFGFVYNGNDVFLDAGVRSGGDNGITEHAENLPEREIVFNSATIWGVPAETAHDTQRYGIDSGGKACGGESQLGGCPAGVGPTPFLTLPTSCRGPQTFSSQVLGTWQDESAVSPLASAVSHDEEGNPVGFTGCGRLVHFEPSVSIAPDTSFADTPTGLAVTVRLPQGVNPEGLATAGLQNTTVTLPEGLVINPGQANGLAACQAAEESLGETNEGPAACPAASKVGTDEIATPLLPDKLQGSVYVLQSNPPNLQLLLTASGDGVNLKLVGNVHLDEATGRLTATFNQTPDLPFTEFKLAFSGGAQAALATPTGCGVYEADSQLTPWSAPLVEDALSVSRFQITAGSGGSPCAAPLPFAPNLIAGATTDQAGGYTSFSLLLARADGQQRISSLQFKVPPGLSGMISKVPLCPEPQAAQGTCPASSQIGHTVVTAGPGPYPLVVPGPGQPAAPIYLTGGYKGAPYGLSIAVPVLAGPFNLGTIVVRSSISVDPHTAQLTVTTDPLPSILDGIPTDLRVINAVIDREGFMFNPTNCSPFEFSGTATSTEGAVAAISSHFQVGSCRSLVFKPNFKVTTSGRTSRKNGASLEAKILYPSTPLGANQASSQANIASVKVDLPKQLPSRLTTLQKACIAAVFDANPANCPAASVVGHATAVTPVLPVALTGPAYFVSHGGEAFPSLVVVLQGYGVTIDLLGTTFINKAGITSSTFKQVPDVPISSFDLTLPEGPYSALAANLPAKAKGSVCGQNLVMPTAFTAQNGAVVKQSTKITPTGCPKAKKAKKAKKVASKRKHGARRTGGARKQR